MNLLRLVFWSACAIAAWYLLQRGQTAMHGETALLLAVIVCLFGVMVLGRARGRGAEQAGMSVASGQRALMKHLAAVAWMGLALLLLFWSGLFVRLPAVRMVEAWEQVFPQPARGQAADEVEEGGSSGAWLREDGARRALPRKTNIKPGRKPEVFLRIEDASLARRFAQQPIYVAAMTFDHYRDSAWEIAAEPARVLEPDAGGGIVIGGGNQDDGIWHTVVLSADVNQRTPLAGLQGIVKVEGTGALERWSGGFHLLPKKEDTAAGYRYRACSNPLRLEDITDQVLEKQRIGDASAWLQIPDDELGRRVSGLASSTVADDSPVRQLRRIQDHLRRNYGYSLATANPRDLDPLENFLFEEKSGHCEYFASAGALLARARGIPARVVYGWAGGTWYEHADWFVFRADEAHAWVEAWLDGYGWVTMDPTPPEALRDRDSRVSREKLPPMPDGADDVLGSPEDDLLHAAGTGFPWIAATLSVCLGGAVIFWRFASRARSAGEARFAAEPWRRPVASHYLDAWRSACRSRHPRRDMAASTLRQQLTWPDSAPEFADDLMRYHYGTRYEGIPRDRVKERELTRRIRAWAADLRE